MNPLTTRFGSDFNPISRRTFVKGTLLSSAGLALALHTTAQETKPAEAAPSAVPAGMPKGKIGKLEISRLIL